MKDKENSNSTRIQRGRGKKEKSSQRNLTEQAESEFLHKPSNSRRGQEERKNLKRKQEREFPSWPPPIKHPITDSQAAYSAYSALVASSAWGCCMRAAISTLHGLPSATRCTLHT